VRGAGHTTNIRRRLIGLTGGRQTGLTGYPAIGPSSQSFNQSVKYLHHSRRALDASSTTPCHNTHRRVHAVQRPPYARRGGRLDQGRTC
jgi:hypothetical protein